MCLLVICVFFGEMSKLKIVFERIYVFVRKFHYLQDSVLVNSLMWLP